jgi:hypothetical protein
MTTIRGGTQIAEFGLNLQPGAKASPCPSISIVVSEPGNSVFRWEMTVWVRYPESNSRIGRFRTLPPVSTGAPNRVVALAYAPGAVGWRIQAKAITPQGGPAITSAKADAWVSRSECCGALTTPGVMPVEVEGVGEPIFDALTGQLSLDSSAATQIIAANPFRRRASIRGGPMNAPGNLIALGTTNAVTLATGRLIALGETFETVYRGNIFARGTAAPAAHDTVSIWIEEG